MRWQMLAHVTRAFRSELWWVVFCTEWWLGDKSDHLNSWRMSVQMTIFKYSLLLVPRLLLSALCTPHTEVPLTAALSALHFAGSSLGRMHQGIYFIFWQCGIEFCLEVNNLGPGCLDLNPSSLIYQWYNLGEVTYMLYAWISLSTC